MVSRAKKSPSRLPTVTEATVPATAADPLAMSPAAARSRSTMASGEIPMRASQPVSVLTHAARAPPGLSPSRTAAVKATAWVTNTETKATTLPTMASPAATTVATDASVGRPLHLARRVWTGCRVKPIRAPSSSPVANGCASHAITTTAPPANHASTWREVTGLVSA